MKTYRTVLFDLDGTILDTNELIITSFLEVLKGTVDEDFNRENIIPTMGETLENQMRRFSGMENVNHFIEAYREVNLRLHDEYVKTFDYVQEVLDRLQQEGIKLGVVTTKMRLTTDRGLAYVDIAKYLQTVVTLDDVENAKPHAEPIQKAMAALQADPATTLMVGDSIVDILSGVNAGVDTAGVAWSLKGEQVLKDAGATYIIHDMRDLYELIGLESR